MSDWCEVFFQEPNETETSEKFETTEQTLKEVRRQEANSLVHIPKDDQQPSGNRLRDTLQRFEKNCIRKPLFARVCGAAAFRELVSVGMRCKTIPHVDDCFGGRTPACREDTHPRERVNSRIYASNPGNTIIGPVLQDHIVKFLDNYGLEIQIPSTVTQGQASWVIFCRGKNRHVDSLSFQDLGRAHTSSESVSIRFIAKPNEPCDVEVESSSAWVGKPIATQTEKSVEGIGETHANQVVEQPKPLDTEEFIDVGDRKWKDIPACRHHNRNTFCRDLKMCCQIRAPL